MSYDPLAAVRDRLIQGTKYLIIQKDEPKKLETYTPESRKFPVPQKRSLK